MDAEKKKCIDLLKNNGWATCFDDFKHSQEYYSFNKDGCISVDISVNFGDMVFIGESGDFLHLSINYYSLIGALICHKSLDCNFKY